MQGLGKAGGHSPGQRIEISIVSETLNLRINHCTHKWLVVCLCSVFLIVTVGDLANKIQRDCGHVAGNVDSLFTELYKL